MGILNQNQNNQINIEKPKGKFWKFILGFFGVIATVFVLYIGGVWAFRTYQQWQGEKAVQKTVEALKKFEADDYAKAMADTYGGKTPQETLQMYIDAVEKGDYELASKYFIGDMQEEEFKRLKNIVANNGSFIEYFSFLKKAEPWRSSLEESEFIMTSKTNLGPSIFVSFKKYPNDIWKLIKM